MTLANPTAVVWALLLVPVVVLYCLQMRPPQYTVQTGFLWDQVIAQEPTRRTWLRWRRPVSLLLQLAILSALVLAVAEPLLRSPIRTVLIIDNSASMNVGDVSPSRLSAAKELALKEVADLAYPDEMAILAAGESLVSTCGLTGRRSALENGIQQVGAGRGGTRVSEAVRRARRVLDGSGAGRIVVLTDGCFDGAQALAADDVRLVLVGTPADNLALSALEVRRDLVDRRRAEIFAQVTSYANEEVRCNLSFHLEGRLLKTLPVTVAPGRRWQETFEITTTQRGQIRASLSCDDALADDNTAVAELADGRTPKVTLVTDGSPLLEKALLANVMVETIVTGEIPPHGSREGILVLEGPVPAKLPQGPMLVIDPAGPSDLWELAGTPGRKTVSQQSEGSPILSHVRLEGIDFGPAQRLVLRDEFQARGEPLAWTAQGVPLVHAIQRPAGRVIVVSCRLDDCGLVEEAAWPVVVSNALEWLAEPQRAGSDRNDGRPRAAGLPAAESDLRVPVQLSSVGAAATGGPCPRLWMVLVAVALVGAAAEWCFFHRRWTS